MIHRQVMHVDAVILGPIWQGRGYLLRGSSNSLSTYMCLHSSVEVRRMKLALSLVGSCDMQQ
jgi:hypothetical protein